MHGARARAAHGASGRKVRTAMACAKVTPLGALARGMLAGRWAPSLWTSCCTGGTSGAAARDLLAWEFAVSLADWEHASAPARVGKRLYEGFFQRELLAERAALT